MEAADLDLPTLVSLAGSSTVAVLLDRIRRAGFDGVLPSHGYVIQRLVDDEPTIKSLAESLGMTPQGASKHVRDLERRGYVERVTTSADQRFKAVRLTSSGRALLAAGRKARADLESEIIDRVGEADAARARNVLLAVLDIAGLGDRIASRSVPLPPE